MAEDAGVFTPRTDQRPECLPVHGRSARPIDGYFSRSRLVLREVDHQTEGLQRPDPDAVGRDTSLDLREWTNSDSVRRARWDWKSCDLQGSVGSNPPSSAPDLRSLSQAEHRTCSTGQSASSPGISR